MNKRSIKAWAETDGKSPRAAQFARKRIQVGEWSDGRWYVTKTEWEQIKMNMPGKGKYIR